MHTQQNDAYSGCLLQDLRGRIDSVQVGHGDVHDYHLRLQRFCGGDRLATIGGLPHDLEVIDLCQLQTDPPAYDAVIIRHQDPYLFHYATPCEIGSSNVSFVPLPLPVTILTRPPSSSTRS